MDKMTELQEALCDVRKAHRMIYAYQQRMLDIIKFIANELECNNEIYGRRYFANTTPSSSWINVSKKLDDAWGFLCSYVFDYDLGEYGLRDGGQFAINIIQYSDTGPFDRRGSIGSNLNTFAKEDESISKLLFVIETCSKKGKLINDIESIVMESEYASRSHTQSVIKWDKNPVGLYSIPIENFIDEQTSIEAIEGFKKFCSDNDLVDF